MNKGIRKVCVTYSQRLFIEYLMVIKKSEIYCKNSNHYKTILLGLNSSMVYKESILKSRLDDKLQ